MSLIVVVLGMHRSGTSCLMQSLHRAGLHLGLDRIEEVSPGNLEGHWEAPEAVAINDHILNLSGGSWSNIPGCLRCDNETSSLMQAFLDRLCVHPVVGWKDPRTTITFPFWKPLLREYVVVACLRHPDSVARSLHTRDGMSMEEGLRTWATYNRHLLEIVAGEPTVFWVDYDAPANLREQHLAALCRRLGLRCDESVLRVFNPYLHHHTPPSAPLDPTIRSLYDRLLDQVHCQSHTFNQTSGTHSNQMNQIEELSRRLEQLGRVATLQNQLLQELRTHHDRLARDVQVMNGVLAGLVRPAEDAYDFVCRLRQSWPFRIARAFGQVSSLIRRGFVRPPQTTTTSAEPVQQRQAA